MADKGITVHDPYCGHVAVMPFKPVKQANGELTSIKGSHKAQKY